MLVIMVIIHILAVCHLIVILINLRTSGLKRLPGIIFIRIYHQNMCTPVILCILDNKVPLISLLFPWSFCRIKLNLNDFIYKMIFIPQPEYLI